jgi:ketosteroid isomerase-like protein
MSQENVEIVRCCCEAFDRGDYEAALEVLAPDVEYDLSHFPDGGVYRGHEGVAHAVPGPPAK